MYRRRRGRKQSKKILNFFQKSAETNTKFYESYKKRTHYGIYLALISAKSTYVEYFQARGLRPGDYLISNSEKHGVLDAKRSLQNWMSYNREKFMVKDRDKIVEEGKKKRHATISWHGLRHGYAQKTHADALIENPRQAQKIVSENLGHHRYKVTRIYLAEAKTKKKTK